MELLSCLQDILADVQRVADALRVPDRGVALVGLLTSRMDAVREAVRPCLQGLTPETSAELCQIGSLCQAMPSMGIAW